MNGNWNGLLGANGGLLSKALNDVVVTNFGKSKDPAKATEWYSVFASGPGIFGLGSKVQGYDITNPKYTNGGVNHFGSPFNFPEEFVSVYRLHPLVPDLLEYRDLTADPNKIVKRIPVVETFQGKATDFTHTMGLANWGLTLGRQRLGLLTLHNSPLFLQNLKIGQARQQDAADRCRCARHHSRPGAWSTTLQRIPSPVWTAPADQLRRLHGSWCGAGVAGPVGAARRRCRHCAKSMASMFAMLRRSLPMRK